MNYKSFLLYTILATLILSGITFNYAFDKHGKPHCTNFVTNVYLYLALSLALVGCFVHLYNNLLNHPSEIGKYINEFDAFGQIYPYLLLSIIVSFVSIIGLVMQDIFSKDGTLTNHTFWLLYIASVSVLLYPIFKSKEYSDLIQPVILNVSAIFLFMSTIVYAYPSFFENTYKKVMIGLFIALLSIIIIETVLLLTGNYTQGKYKFISYFVIGMFSVFISYDTSRILQLAEKCINSPNYPRISNKLFLDILNLFMRLIGTRRK